MPSTTASRLPYRRRARRMNSSGVNGSSIIHLAERPRVYAQPPTARWAELSLPTGLVWRSRGAAAPRADISPYRQVSTSQDRLRRDRHGSFTAASASERQRAARRNSEETWLSAVVGVRKNATANR